MWQVARVVNAHGNLKVILLADLAKVPLIGWGLRLFEFVFIEKGRHHPAAAAAGLARPRAARGATRAHRRARRVVRRGRAADPLPHLPRGHDDQLLGTSRRASPRARAALRPAVPAPAAHAARAGCTPRSRPSSAFDARTTSGMKLRPRSRLLPVPSPAEPVVCARARAPDPGP